MIKNIERGTLLLLGAIAMIVFVFYWETLPSQLPVPVGTYKGSEVFVTTYPNRICISSGINQNCGTIPINGEATALSLPMNSVVVFQIKILSDGSYKEVTSDLDP